MLFRVTIALLVLFAIALAQVPADFPKDIPIYKGAKVTKWDTNGPIRVLYLEVKADKADVVAFYKQELAAKGWKIAKAFSGSPDAFQATLGPRGISFGTLARNDITVIQIGLMPQG